MQWRGDHPSLAKSTHPKNCRNSDLFSSHHHDCQIFIVTFHKFQFMSKSVIPLAERINLWILYFWFVPLLHYFCLGWIPFNGLVSSILSICQITYTNIINLANLLSHKTLPRKRPIPCPEWHLGICWALVQSDTANMRPKRRGNMQANWSKWPPSIYTMPGLANLLFGDVKYSSSRKMGDLT